MQPKLTRDKQLQVCSAISLGATRVMAANIVGCHPSTIWSTARRDKTFAAELRRAQESPELTHLMAVANASSQGKQWRASIWALERLFPERFAKRSPNVFTLDQMREVMQGLVETVSRSVPGKATRAAIRKSIEEYANSLGTNTCRPKIARKKRHVPGSATR